MALWLFDAERERGNPPLSFHPDDPPPYISTAAHLIVWQSLPEFEGLDPNV